MLSKLGTVLSKNA